MRPGVSLIESDGIAVVRLENGPLTPLTAAMRARLHELADILASRRDIRAVVLTSASARALSVGSDIAEFPRDGATGRETSVAEHRAYRALEELPQPVIAVLRGHTIGGGLELALAADLRIAEQNTALGFPEVRLGVFASGGGTQRLPALIGRGRAAEMLMLGNLIDARTALTWGLVTRVVPEGDGENAAVEMAREIARLPRRGVQATKTCLRRGLLDGRTAGDAAEIDAIADLYTSPDAVEGRRAFLDKRKPVFTHL